MIPKDYVCVATTGLASVDAILCLREGQLVLVGARPDMGEVSLTLKMATSTAKKLRRPVAFFSMELGRRELMRHFVWAEAGVPRGTELDDDDGVRQAIGDWRNGGVWVGEAYDADTICDQVRRFDRESACDGGHPLAMVVIEYLQLIGGASDAINMRTLRALSREIKGPVVVIHRLGRQCEKRADKRPGLRDLQVASHEEEGVASVRLDRDADAVVFVYRDEMYNKNTEDKGIAEIIIAKQRGGTCGTVKVKFDSASGAINE